MTLKTYTITLNRKEVYTAANKEEALAMFHDDLMRAWSEEELADIETGDTRGDEVSITWCIEDVKQRIEERNEAGEEIEMSDDECRTVLRALERKHDATIGINWDTIDYWIDEIIRDRKE